MMHMVQEGAGLPVGLENGKGSQPACSGFLLASRIPPAELRLHCEVPLCM